MALRAQDPAGAPVSPRFQMLPIAASDDPVLRRLHESGISLSVVLAGGSEPGAEGPPSHEAGVDLKNQSAYSAAASASGTSGDSGARPDAAAGALVALTQEGHAKEPEAAFDTPPPPNAAQVDAVAAANSPAPSSDDTAAAVVSSVVEGKDEPPPVTWSSTNWLAIEAREEFNDRGVEDAQPLPQVDLQFSYDDDDESDAHGGAGGSAGDHQKDRSSKR